MVIGERVGRYTQQKGQPRSGLCQAVRGGRGRHQCLSNPVHGNAGQAPPPVSRRHTGVGRRGALAQCSSAARQRVPSVQTPVWIGAQGTARPICPYVSRADGGNMGRDRIAWRVLLGRGEGRRRGGAGGAVVLLLVCWLVCELRDGSGAGWQGGRSAAGLARRFLLSPTLPMRKSSLCRVLLFLF